MNMRLNFVKRLMFCRCCPKRLVGNQLSLPEGSVCVALVDTVLHQLTTNGIDRATCDNTAEVTHQITMVRCSASVSSLHVPALCNDFTVQPVFVQDGRLMVCLLN